MTARPEIAELRRRLAEAGVFRHDAWMSWAKFALHMAVAGALIWLCTQVPLVALLLITPVAAVIYAIGVMMGHDGTHRSAFADNFQNDLLRTLAFPLAAGLSGLYWKYKHNGLHHRYVNVIGRDEDLELWPFALGRSYHETSSALRRWFQRRLQGLLFWPGTTFLPPDLRMRSVRYLISHARERGVDLAWLIDVAAMLGHVALWLVLPSVIYGVVPALLFYLYFWSFVGTYLSILGMTGHAGLPLVDSFDDGWRIQFECTRNVKLGRVMSWCFVGLDYQIEHHLFPQVSHFKYRAAAGIVKDFARQHGLPYHEQALWPCLVDVTRYLRRSWDDRNFRVERDTMTEVPARPARPTLGAMRSLDGDGRRIRR